MKITPKDIAKPLAKTELLCVFAFSSGKPELPDGVKIAPSAASDFQGDFRELRRTDATAGSAARVVLVGLGSKKELDLEKLRRAAAVAVKAIAAKGPANATFWCPASVSKACKDARDVDDTGCALAEGAIMGAYRYLPLKTESKPHKLKSINLCGDGRGFAAGVRKGVVLAEANCFARDLQNAPGNEMTPRDMAAAARKIARGSERVSCKVFDQEAMKRMGMGALLGVSAGSVEPPQLIHLTYKPRAKSKRKVAIVGKGLTFDAGGISLKPSAKMWDMKYDMSGGAAILGAFHALARHDVPIEVHGIVPASENLPDAKAVKPGDVVTAMNGTTIEVLNTDAEGRLILSDALCYTVSKIKPDTIVDLATLTGAVVVALGHELSGMFSTTERLRDSLTRAGEAVGEAVWPLPLCDFHKEQMKGEVADLRNINSPAHGNGSTSGAAFLAHFVGDTEWAHLDIAGTAWGGRDRDWVGGSLGSGVGVRLLTRWLEERG